MTKKWKIFGYQTNLEWYDIRTKVKQLLRKMTYSWFFQELICFIILYYMKLVFYSCKKTFLNEEVLLKAIKDKTPILISFWHNRLMMIPFITTKPKKLYSDYNFMTLSSRHGDGRFVGKVMEKIGLISIYGSSKDGRKASRGIDISSLKQIIKGLKNGLSLGITPDGPRGPNQKINGDIINIARISKAKILPTSYSCSRNIRLKSWDKFYIPLPFSNLCFYFDNSLIEAPNKIDEKYEEELKTLIENRMNFVQEESQRKVLRTF